MQPFAKTVIRAAAIIGAITAVHLTVIPSNYRHRYVLPSVHERLTGLALQINLPWSIAAATLALLAADIPLASKPKSEAQRAADYLKLRLSDPTISPSEVESIQAVLSDLLSKSEDEKPTF